jgi:ATP-dependent Clp protease protease subunit
LFANGIIMLNDYVDNDTVEPIVKALMMYPLLDDPPDSINFVINSIGGSAFSAYHLIDMMKQSPIPIVTIGMGCVASAGVMLLMAGEKGHRFVTENTYIMSHQYSTGTEGKEHELYSALKDFELQTSKMVNHYKKCTKKSESYIRKHLLSQSDIHLSPEEAVKHGICDHVLDIY